MTTMMIMAKNKIKTINQTNIRNRIMAMSALKKKKKN